MLLISTSPVKASKSRQIILKIKNAAESLSAGQVTTSGRGHKTLASLNLFDAADR